MMGSDLSVVNDARASFHRVSSVLDDRDKKLISYLVDHDHTSPLRGTVFKFRITAPLFVCRQWWKHIIASVHASDQIGWNEKSYRYTEAKKGCYYIPKVFLSQSKDNRQASGKPLHQESQDSLRAVYIKSCQAAFKAYHQLIESGASREMARNVLPLSTYTTWVWTCSLQAVLHFIQLRLGHGAQKEIQHYASAIHKLIACYVPVTIKAWEKKQAKKENKV